MNAAAARHTRGEGTGAFVVSWLGRSRLFRYEIRRWRNGIIPDIAEAVASPRRLSSDADRARRVLALVPGLPHRRLGTR